MLDSGCQQADRADHHRFRSQRTLLEAFQAQTGFPSRREVHERCCSLQHRAAHFLLQWKRISFNIVWRGNRSRDLVRRLLQQNRPPDFGLVVDSLAAGEPADEPFSAHRIPARFFHPDLLVG